MSYTLSVSHIRLSSSDQMRINLVANVFSFETNAEIQNCTAANLLYNKALPISYFAN